MIDWSKAFPVICITRNDLKEAGITEAEIATLTDEDMQNIASKVEDCFDDEELSDHLFTSARNILDFGIWLCRKWSVMRVIERSTRTGNLLLLPYHMACVHSELRKLFYYALGLTRMRFKRGLCFNGDHSHMKRYTVVRNK